MTLQVHARYSITVQQPSKQHPLKMATITVDLCLTHHGHQKDLQHTWLPKQKKEEMAALLQQGVSKDKILGDIREHGIQGESFKRYHLTDRKDLSNISRAFGFGGDPKV